MAEIAALAEAWLWDRYMGAVAEMDDGSIAFEYAEEFLSGGLNPSPFLLPAGRGVFTFPDLARKRAFQGLPGLLADALPDAFGTAVIRSYFTARGEMSKSLSPVQHLLYVGDRALGALSFRPAMQLTSAPRVEEALDLAVLVADARRIVQGSAEVAIPELYRIGSSAGGMRPKAVVLHNPASGEVRSAYAAPREGDVAAILKFDGVGESGSGRDLGRPEPYNRIEAAYAQMARAAGLHVVDVAILESEQGHAHLIIPRFDVTSRGRLHQPTLGGLLHVDYNDVGASSYEEYLRTIQGLGMGAAAVAEGWRRMSFNVLAVNQDDHVKNLSFHMDERGVWTLAPAYDVTFAHGGTWTVAHQMRVADKRVGITRRDLLGVAERFAIRGAREALERIEAAVADWPQYAEACGVEAAYRARIQSELDERRSSLS